MMKKIFAVMLVFLVGGCGSRPMFDGLAESMVSSMAEDAGKSLKAMGKEVGKVFDTVDEENKKQRQLGERGIAKCRSCKYVFYHSGAASCPKCKMAKGHWDYLKPNSAEAKAFRASVAEKERLKEKRDETFQVFYEDPERWAEKSKLVVYTGDFKEIIKTAIAEGEKGKWDGVWLEKFKGGSSATFYRWDKE